MGVLAVGGGVALAETAPEDPEVVEAPANEETVAPAPEEEAPAPEAEAPEVEDDADEADEAEDADGEESGEHPDNHGAVVSAAAQDHSHDEACGNHGKVVSAVAHTGELPECAGGPAAEDSAQSSKGKGKAHKSKAEKKK